MNCCDDFGNCRQGRDCPVRRQRANKPVQYRTGFDRLDAVLNAIANGVAILGAWCVVMLLAVLVSQWWKG